MTVAIILIGAVLATLVGWLGKRFAPLIFGYDR